MDNKNKVPTIPEVAFNVLPEDTKRLEQWRKLFKKLGCQVITGYNSMNLTNPSEGRLMYISLNATAVKKPEWEEPWVEAYFEEDDKATICIVWTVEEWRSWFEKLKELKCPISEEEKHGSWNDIYNLMIEFIKFKNERIPKIPIPY